MKQAVLLPNIVGFPSESMRRYAMELEGALRQVAGDAGDWSFEAIECKPEEAVARRFGGANGEKMAGRHARFIKYPQLIRSRARASVYHVLDHSHASLALVPPAAQTVLTCHDIIPLLAARGLIPMPTGRFTKYTFPLRVQCMKRCQTVIAISESTKRNLVEVAGIPENKVAVVYYGVNRAFAPLSPKDSISYLEERQTLLAKHQIPSNARVLFHVGTATRYKNTPAILHALKALREDPDLGDNVWFLRVGADFFDDEKELIEQLGIGDRIRHAGRIFDDNLLASYYRAGDVFVFPSIWEGFGWPPLEAMACGTPVVTSDVASLPEVVGDAGITVAPLDHSGLIEALRRILTNEDERQQFRERCLVRARRFTWEECARGTLQVYENVARAAR